MKAQVTRIRSWARNQWGMGPFVAISAALLARDTMREIHANAREAGTAAR